MGMSAKTAKKGQHINLIGSRRELGLSKQFRIMDLGSRTQDLQDAGSRILDAESTILNPGSWSPYAGSRRLQSSLLGHIGEPSL